MTRFVLYRVAQSLFVVVGVVLLTFVIVRLVPGDPAVGYAGSRATPGQLAAAREKLGLDGSVFTQLQHYIADLLNGDLGVSIHTRQTVVADLTHFVPASIELVLFAMVIAVPVGFAIGRFAARHHGKAADIVMRIMTVLAVSFPAFWLGLILQTTFASTLGWFPIAGEYTSSLDGTSPLHVWTNLTLVDAAITGNGPVFLSTLQHLVLPGLVVAAYPVGAIAQLTRAGLTEELGQDHIRTVRALGFSSREVIGRFAMRPVLSPILTLIALVFAYSLVNAFIVESIFNWPGVGRYTTEAIQSLDTPAIAGVTLVVAIIYVLINLVVDIAQAFIDPRVRVQ
ncbi:ABC transporter permease [Cryobacterium tagatosivorans]|uniref:ABC transporter permease n=1 Tax=Cryobacterium tagatosivorans TaxID=1259199 RepID=A0A4R8UK90_9MICO|nr:ABC transporter permease [Cryobacterium tagatosivorans]TFB56374.1 ABC transporter permease [Cryobacterium tagatosivorans]